MEPFKRFYRCRVIAALICIDEVQKCSSRLQQLCSGPPPDSTISQVNLIDPLGVDHARLKYTLEAINGFWGWGGWSSHCASNVQEGPSTF